MTTLTILTWNTLFAGRDGADDRRARAQIQLLQELKPDVFLMQEAKGFDANGGELLHALEAAIGMRGFLAVAPRTGQNLAIFIREPLRPLSFETDGANFHHALATLKVALPDGGKTLNPHERSPLPEWSGGPSSRSGLPGGTGCPGSTGVADGRLQFGLAPRCRARRL
jgi:hypothetical protein